MLWPVPVNVRMNPFRASGLLDVLLNCESEEMEIADFPEYASELNAGQMIRLKAIAQEIIRSHETRSPIAGIVIIGHADRALRLSGVERTRKEMEVSEARAAAGQEHLLKMLHSLPGGDRVAAMIHNKPVGDGANHLQIPNAVTEAQMRQNRRVVFKWSRCALPNPIIHLPEFPRPSGRRDEDDPSIVFAGSRFKLKILDGVAVGLGVAGFTYQMLLWDVDNSRACQYTYTGATKSVGIPPFTECGESDWSEVFSTKTFAQVDQFSGLHTHAAASLALVSGMDFKFGTFTDARIELPFTLTVRMFMGPSKSIAADLGGAGPFRKIPGSVMVFRGP